MSDPDEGMDEAHDGFEEGLEPSADERFSAIIKQLAPLLGLASADEMLRTRRTTLGGFDVVLDHFDNDPGALYIQFDYGITTAGRTLSILRLMLESNLLVYAQDQAQLGLDPETGNTMLIVRVPMGDEIDGAWVLETLNHYIGHGQYWRDHILQAPDEQFEALTHGDYLWLRA